jgi:hypothetical protein
VAGGGDGPHTRAGRSTPALPLVTRRRGRRRRPGVDGRMAACARPPDEPLARGSRS